MPAMILTLPTTVSGTHEKFKADPILPSNGGAVFLVDPTNPLEQWASGLPANGVAIPNLVEHQPELGSTPLQAAIGGVLPLSYFTDGLLTGSFGKMERTGKGGLHTIISQNDALGDLASHTGGKYFQAIRAALGYSVTPGSSSLNASDNPFTQYMYGTDGTNGAYRHSYYLSMWSQITRRTDTPGSQVNAVAGLGMVSSFTSSYNCWLLGPKPNSSGSALPGPAQAHYGGVYTRLGGVGLGYELQQVASTDRLVGSGTVLKNSTTLSAMDGGQGYYIGSSTTARGSAGSYIFYRSYMEDLTVSGRTFAQVAALDQALYTQEVLTPGGRFYGDTFTDPATIP